MFDDAFRELITITITNKTAFTSSSYVLRRLQHIRHTDLRLRLRLRAVSLYELLVALGHPAVVLHVGQHPWGPWPWRIALGEAEARLALQQLLRQGHEARLEERKRQLAVRVHHGVPGVAQAEEWQALQAEAPAGDARHRLWTLCRSALPWL